MNLLQLTTNSLIVVYLSGSISELQAVKWSASTDDKEKPLSLGIWRILSRSCYVVGNVAKKIIREKRDQTFELNTHWFINLKESYLKHLKGHVFFYINTISASDKMKGHCFRLMCGRLVFHSGPNFVNRYVFVGNKMKLDYFVLEISARHGCNKPQESDCSRSCLKSWDK